MMFLLHEFPFHKNHLLPHHIPLPLNIHSHPRLVLIGTYSNGAEMCRAVLGHVIVDNLIPTLVQTEHSHRALSACTQM